MTQFILVNISGEDKAGLTSQIMGIMAQFDVEILDLGQSVIHNHLTWGMLISVPEAEAVSGLLKDMLFRCHELQLRIRFEPVSDKAFQEWLEGKGKNRYIVTVLARAITAEHLARVSTITTHHGLNIDAVSRLSSRSYQQLPLDKRRCCIEFSVRGNAEDVDGLRAAFLRIGSELNIDVAFQEDTIYRRNRRLVVFDMDSTLIEVEVIDELAKRAGVGQQVAAITERAMRGELDFNESFAERIVLLKGMKEEVLDDVLQQLPLTEGAERLVHTLRTLGYKTAILSGGFTYFADALKERLGIDYVYANTLEIIDGQVSGEVVGQIVDGKRKAELLNEIAAKENLCLDQVIAVGDGANDLPMLSQAGLGVAFRAKPLVKESAKHSISTLGLDGILYLLGFGDMDG